MEHVNVVKARELLKVSRRTVFNWMKSGKLATVKVGRSQRVLVASIEAVRVKP